MNVNEVVSFNAQITLKDTNGSDTIVAFLSANLDAGLGTFNISMNPQNKVLLNTENAVNASNETALAQFTTFKTEVESRAKEMGYTIFE